jgi:hypothetical protein
MNTSLRDLLREKVREQEAMAESSKATLTEWGEGIDNHFKILRGWLTQSDPVGIIQVEESTLALNEPGLGRYEIPQLELHALGETIGIVPRGYGTVGTAVLPHTSTRVRARGRVDITNEIRQHILYRFRDENDKDLWMVEHLRLDVSPTPLDQKLFESILMSYLR